MYFWVIRNFINFGLFGDKFKVLERSLIDFVFVWVLERIVCFWFKVIFFDFIVICNFLGKIIFWILIWIIFIF